MRDVIGMQDIGTATPAIEVQLLIVMRLHFPGCDYFFDGLVCWPSTPPGGEAGVNCWSIEAFARALGKNNKSGIHGKD